MLAAAAATSLAVLAVLGWSALSEPEEPAGKPKRPAAAKAPEAEPEPDADPWADAALTGRVIDRDARTGIPRAQVVVSCGAGEASEDVATTTTDGRGRFAVDTLPVGQCRVRAAQVGYVAGGPMSGRPVRLRVGDGESVRGLMVPLSRSATLSGRAVEGEAPVANVALTLLYLEATDEPDAFSVSVDAVTDGDGRFTVKDVLPGRVQLLAEHDDYALVETPAFYVAPGELKQDLVVSMRDGARVSGVVVDDLGSPVVGARVVAKGPDGRQEVLASKQGIFAFGSLMSGRVEVSASARGYGRGAPVVLDVKVGEPEDLTIVLPRQVGFGGVVQTPDGEPIPQALVRMEAVDGTPLSGLGRRQTMKATDAAGRFFFDSPGRWPVRVIASHQKYGESEARLVEDVGAELVLELAPGGSLIGDVTDGSGRPLSVFRVSARLIPAEGATGPFKRGVRTAQRVADSSGTFEFASLAPGLYAVEVAAPGRPVQTVESFEVFAGQQTDVGTIVVEAGATVVGQVVDQDGGAPIAGASVGFAGSFGRRLMSRRRVRTDAEGRFELNGLPPDTKLTVQAQARGYVLRLVSGIDVPDGDVLDLGVISLAASDGGGPTMQYSGVGMSLRSRDGRLVVQNVFDGSPAGELGLESGTEILAVGGRDTGEMDLREAVELIRGEAGSSVTLEILSPGGEYTETVDIERGEVTARFGRRNRVRP